MTDEERAPYEESAFDDKERIKRRSRKSPSKVYLIDSNES